MDYEKKYKELVGKIDKAYLSAQTDSTKAVLEEIRPELKEDKDDRIRRNIIAALKGEGYYDCDLTSECIAWVEKQGEQNPTAWSDQDEENLQHSTGAIMAADYYTIEDKAELCQWVESLKERVQPQAQQLKTEDYERLKRISQFVWNNRKGDTDEIYQQEQDVKWLVNKFHIQ